LNHLDTGPLGVGEVRSSSRHPMWRVGIANPFYNKREKHNGLVSTNNTSCPFKFGSFGQAYFTIVFKISNS
jgi:hypothetical protein